MPAVSTVSQMVGFEHLCWFTDVWSKVTCTVSASGSDMPWSSLSLLTQWPSSGNGHNVGGGAKAKRHPRDSEENSAGSSG